MNIELIKKALRLYAASAECPNNERNDVFEALDEIAETVERYDDMTMWKGAARLIPLPALIDLLNITTYDDYGKLARFHKGEAPFDYYTHVVRNNLCPGFAALTDRQLRDGYDLIHDLWNDNDANNDNNDDGTFKR